MQPAASCPKCGTGFVDSSGQFAACERLVREGKLALFVGCTQCRLLFAPVSAEVAATAISHPPRSPSTPPPTRYQKLRELGEGGMGITYVALDRTSQRQVCIKQLRAGIDVASLRHEWKALAAIEHPSIVRLLDFYEEAGMSHLVMELVDGVALDRVVASNTTLPESSAIEIAAQLCNGLDAIHARGVVHRDIKPANVLLEWQAGRLVVRIVDFGIAVVDDIDAFGARTGAGNLAGTPYYMAPEQFAAQLCTPAVDVFAVGMTLVELIAGTDRIRAPSLADLVAQRSQIDGFDVRDACSPAVAAVIHAMTRREPQARLSARATAERLQALLPAIHSPELRTPLNLELGRADPTGIPLGWCNGTGFVANVSTTYSIATRGDELLLAAPDSADHGFGTAMQRVHAGHLVGEHLRFSGELATEGCTSAALWIRLDRADGRQLLFDNMSDRALRGTVGFTPCSIEVAVPTGCTWLNFGVLLVGRGRVTARNLALRTARRSLSLDLRGNQPSNQFLT